MACIYQIKNKVNNKIYIGSTQKINSLLRKIEHFCKLNGNYHNNKHLQSSFNIHGADNFVFEIIESFQFPENYNKECIYEYVTGRELYYINLLSPEYNICKEISGGKLGKKMSEENKDNLKKLFTGRKVSDETKAKIKLARSKQIITEEHKRKISLATIGISKIGNTIRSLAQRELASINALEQISKGIGMHSVTSKEKRTKTLKQLYNTPEMKLKLKDSARNRNRKSFSCFKNNILVKEFNNQIEASEYLGFLNPGGISAVLNNIQKIHKGYTFIYNNI